jgi:aminopeptidase N
MKHLFLILISLASLQLAYAQQNIKPSCRNHKSGIALRQPTAGELARMEAMAFRSDTFDITHYSIHLEEVNYGLKTIDGFCEVSFFAKRAGRSDIHLDLLNLPVDSVKQGDQPLNFIYDSLMVHIYFDEVLSVNDTQTVTIWYGGRPTLDPSGFGGFDFQDGYAYNLGIGLASIPHNFGRGWFPCFDNFVERASFDFYVTTETTKFAYCVGTHVATEALGNGKQRFHYRMDQPITTYHAAVAVADYALTRTFHGGQEKEIPVELVSKPQDTTKFRNSFAFLHEAIESLEQWYGPYPWERVGYVITTVGAMEHPTCIAYPASLGLNENPYNNMDIMSHELAHHWFGNVTTLTTAYDMWIKEGTSEYGYHLFTKDFLGDEEFYDLIADNQFDVLENAHRQDEDFRALSGMPMEFTYGMTTYQKGAAVIHNLHSYLGDSLFKVGVRTLLNDYAFSHCDAAEFEASFTQSTGKDMSDFFRDWIYAPGFSAFEIDSVRIEPTGSDYEITLYIEQKRWHAPHFHTKVPMTVTFIDDHGKKHPVQFELDGQYTEVNLRLDFHPAFQFLNENSFLNNGQLSYDRVIGEDDKYNFRRSHLDIDATGVTDSFLLFVEHIWGAPDPLKRTDLDIDLSDNHYWIIDGTSTHNARLSTRFYYAGNHKDELDYDLVSETEEDIILLYRRNAGEDWVEYPYAFKNIFIPTDKKGFFVVDSLLFGQYCFGNGDYFAVGTDEDPFALLNRIRISPNPASRFIDVSIDNPGGLSHWQLLDLTGRVVKNGTLSLPQFRIELYDLPAGTYTCQVYDEKGVNKGIQKLIKME